MVVDPVKQRKAKQSKAKERKGKQKKTKHAKKSFNISSEIHQNCIEIKVQRGSGELLGLSLLQVALSWASWGVLGSIWSNKLAKNYRRQLLFYVVGLFGMLLGAQVGSKMLSWLHLGLDFWSLWVDFGSIF